MISIVYFSTAPQKLETEELDAILAQSRRNNERDGITGMLLYVDGNFVQAVEGEEHALYQLLDRLAKDPRHAEITVVARYPIQERQFPDWSMGFRRLRGAAPAEVAEAFASLREPIFDPAEVGSNSIAHRLLANFQETNRA